MVKNQARAGRSPSYPDLDLQEATEKAQVLWDRENRNLAPVTTIQEHWGYKVNTGPAVRAVAALKKFGLLVDQGRGDSRQARLTELALSIILDERENRSERDAAIREAALTPPIHADLWEQYKGNLPSDSTLQFVLQKERRFSTRGATALIEEFRSTIAFAKLETSDNIAAKEDEEPDGDDNHDMPTDPLATSPNPFKERLVATETETAQTRILQLPLLGDTWAAIQLPQSMSEPEWNQMMAVLEAMKPGIVSRTRGNASELYRSGQPETGNQ